MLGVLVSGLPACAPPGRSTGPGAGPGASTQVSVGATAGSDSAGSDPAHTAGAGRGGRPAAGGQYLALGDSVPFGYSPLTPIGSDPSRYVGYPQFAARSLGLTATDLSCPGQTSSSYLSLDGDDNGCFTFRATSRLHTDYTTAQAAAASAFLAAHPDTRLVTVMLGANDLFRCVDSTADRCTDPAEIASTLSRYSRNLSSTLTALRSSYRGRIVVVTYYTLNFADPLEVAGIKALNATAVSVAARFKVDVADGYEAFAARARPFRGSACAAGLLIKLPNGGCDIHPSPKGARVLAQAVTAAARP